MRYLMKHFKRQNKKIDFECADELETKKASTAAAKAHAHLGRGQTWQQWMDENGGDSSEFFTMDYSRVRRRRPIHNKGLPVGP